MTIEEVLESPPGTEFDLSLSEQELNQAAANLLSTQTGFPLESPHVSLQDGLVVLEATTEFSGIPLRAAVSGTPLVEGGTLRFDVTDMLINGGAAPAFVRSQVAESINEQLRGPAFPLTVEHVAVSSGRLEVKGRKR